MELVIHRSEAKENSGKHMFIYSMVFRPMLECCLNMTMHHPIARGDQMCEKEHGSRWETTTRSECQGRWGRVVVRGMDARAHKAAPCVLREARKDMPNQA